MRAKQHVTEYGVFLAKVALWFLKSKASSPELILGRDLARDLVNADAVKTVLYLYLPLITRSQQPTALHKQSRGHVRNTQRHLLRRLLILDIAESRVQGSSGESSTIFSELNMLCG